MLRFADQVVLVTGATTGIGRATLARLRKEGARVVAAHRRDPATVDLCGAPSVRLDVTNEADWQVAVKKVMAEHGRIDVLVNNAGMRASGIVEDTDRATWDELIETNLTSVFLGCRAVVPQMKTLGAGAIVNVGSITGLRGTEDMVAYSASKSGITAMTASMALDLASSGIRVNAVCPAAIETRMVTKWVDSAERPDAARAAVLAKHPIGRIGTPEEVASVIAFLASDDASFMTGLSIPVDGGRSIR